MDSKLFGEKLAKLRKKNNMTQAELASKLYISNKTISKWESGNSIPSHDDMIKISEIFSISFDELYGRKKKKINIRIFLFVFLILIVFIFYCVYKRQHYDLYNVYITSSSFYIKDGLYIENDKHKTLIISDVGCYSEGVTDIEYIVNYEDKVVSRSLPYHVDNFKDINKFSISINGIVDNQPVSYTFKLYYEEYKNRDLKFLKIPSIPEVKNIAKYEYDGFEFKEVYYTKVKKNTTYNIFPLEEMCEKIVVDEKFKTIYTYYYNHERVTVMLYMYDKLVNNYEYDISRNELNCKLGDCKDYQNVVIMMKKDFSIVFD